MILFHLNRQHAGGRRERLHIAIGAQLAGSQHKFGPNGGGRMRALHFDVGVIVVAHPDEAEKV